MKRSARRIDELRHFFLALKGPTNLHRADAMDTVTELTMRMEEGDEMRRLLHSSLSLIAS